MKITIEMHFFDGKSESFETDKNRFIIGRGNKADVIVNKEGFSREHCLIEYGEEGFFITDLGSTNGVRINNEDLPKNVRTEYNSFLPLSIGFAENVILEVLEKEEAHFSNPNLKNETLASKPQTQTRKAPLHKPDNSSTGEIKRSQYATSTKSSKKGGDTGPKAFIVLALLGAVLCAVYFFTQKDSEEVSSPASSKSQNSNSTEYIEF